MCGAARRISGRPTSERAGRGRGSFSTCSLSLHHYNAIRKRNVAIIYTYSKLNHTGANKTKPNIYCSNINI